MKALATTRGKIHLSIYFALIKGGVEKRAFTAYQK